MKDEQMERLTVIEFIGGVSDGEMKVLPPDARDPPRLTNTKSFNDNGGTDSTPSYTYVYSHEETSTVTVTKKFYKVATASPNDEL